MTMAVCEYVTMVVPSIRSRYISEYINMSDVHI